MRRTLAAAITATAVITAPSVTVQATGTDIDPTPDSGVIATFEGQELNLAEEWGEATACHSDDQGTRCYRTLNTSESAGRFGANRCLRQIGVDCDRRGNREARAPQVRRLDLGDARLGLARASTQSRPLRPHGRISTPSSISRIRSVSVPTPCRLATSRRDAPDL